MGQEAARKTNIILREVVKNGYLAVRLTVRVNPPSPLSLRGAFDFAL